MKNKPDVSIIIPTYNRPNQIIQAIESVITQNVSHEIIVVVDGCDRSMYDSIRISYPDVKIIFIPHSGVEIARNVGFTRSKGKYVQFLDDDDLILNGKLSEQVNYLNKYPQYNIVYSKWSVYYNNSIGVVEGEYPMTRPHNYRLLLSNYAPIHSYLIRRTKIDIVGGFDINSFNLEDWDFIWRLTIEGDQLVHAGEHGAVYRMHDNNMSNDAKFIYNGALLWMEQSLRRFEKNINEYFKRLAYSSILIERAGQYYRIGKYRHAIRDISDAIDLYPNIIYRAEFFDRLTLFLSPYENGPHWDSKDIFTQEEAVIDLLFYLFESLHSYHNDNEFSKSVILKSRDCLKYFMDRYCKNPSDMYSIIAGRYV